MSKILLVEDDNNLREIYEARLQAEGYEIASAKDGEEALVVAKQVKPDLIIADVMMPKISGFEMLDILRNTDGFKQTKVIMLTALGQTEDKSRAESLGADRYLVKSQVTLEDIVKTAHELLGDLTDQAAATAPDPMTAAPQPMAAPALGVTPPAPMASPSPMPMSTPPEEPAADAPPTPMMSVSPAPDPMTAAPQPMAAPALGVTPPAPMASPSPMPMSTPTSMDDPSDFSKAVDVSSETPDTPDPIEGAHSFQPPAADSSPIGGSFSPTAAVATSSDSSSDPTPMSTQPAAPAEPDLPALDDAQSAAQEETTMTSQIDNFVNSSPTDNQAVPAAPAEPINPDPMAAPALGATPPAQSAASSSDDKVMQNALDTLQADTDQTKGSNYSSDGGSMQTTPIGSSQSSVVAPPVPTEGGAQFNELNEAQAQAQTNEDSLADSNVVAHKKVIQPLEASAKPDIHSLLAAEEAKEQANLGVPTPSVGTVIGAQPSNDAMGGAEAPGAAPTPPLPEVDNSSDPNNIAL
jgi:CheY-like chemotaxis protein